MIALPENPTLADICHRSAVLHPSLLADALQAQAKRDLDYAATQSNPRTVSSIQAHARHCENGACAVRTYDSQRDNWALMPLGLQIVTANEAGRLQCLPRHVLTQAAIRTDDARC